MTTEIERWDPEGNPIAFDVYSGKEVSRQFFGTQSGQVFLADYNSDENFRFLVSKVEATGRPITSPNLVAMFNSLIRIGGIKKVAAPAKAVARPVSRNPLTGEVVPHELMDFYLNSSRAEQKERQRVDPAFDKLVKDIVRYEMTKLPAEHPASGIPQEPKRAWIPEARYQFLKKFAAELRAMPADEIRKRQTPGIVGEEEAAIFKRDFEEACEVFQIR